MITVTAIVGAFAAECMGVEWKWLKPVVEMLVLAELLGVVVLERRQLFEPIHETVEAIQSRTEDLY